jgi:hypothetical protein
MWCRFNTAGDFLVPGPSIPSRSENIGNVSKVIFTKAQKNIQTQKMHKLAVSCFDSLEEKSCASIHLAL